MKDVKYCSEVLGKVSGGLGRGAEFDWRFSNRASRNPLEAGSRADWKKWDPSNPAPLRKNARNWFYAEVVFPEKMCGLDMAGVPAHLYFNGYCPFTLWVDGEEKHREEHVWYASGPLADPLLFTISPGRRNRLDICLEPTELPFKFNPLQMTIVPEPVLKMQWRTAAAWAELLMADALASDENERRLVSKACGIIDLAALESFRWADFLKSVSKMESMLAPLAPRCKAHTVHLIGHTHIDMDWCWTWKDTLNCIRRDFHSVLNLMDDYPDVKFSLSQIPSYAAVKEHDPANFARTLEYIKKGRWENLASTWVEGDLNMADGESIARHLLYAADWSEKNLGRRAECFWAPDTFGHPGNMPQIAKLGGCTSYFHWRCNPGGWKNQPARIWTGVDGTRMTTVSSAYGGTLLFGPSMFMSLCNTLDNIRLGLNVSHYVWGLGDHGGGLSRQQLKFFEEVRNRPLLPTYEFSTMAEYLNALRRDTSKLPKNCGETHTLFEGCYTSHAGIKKYNRRCESALLDAEAALAMAGLDRNDIIRDAWTPVLFSQFHDIFCGCAVHDSYKDAYRRAQSSLRTAGKIVSEAASRIAGDGRNGAGISIINQLGFARSEPVEVDLPEKFTAIVLPDEEELPVQNLGKGRGLLIPPEVPAFGTAFMGRPARRADSSRSYDVKDDGYYFNFETNHASCRIAKNSGAVCSWFDKRLGRELVPYGTPKPLQHVQNSRADMALNVFQVIDEDESRMPAWLMNDILREESLLRGAEVSLLDSGPVCVRFKVAHRFRSSSIDEEIRFYRYLPRADFNIRVDWREKGRPGKGIPHLKLSFAAAMSAARLRSEGPYTVREAAADGMENVTQKWADLTGDEFGFALLNDSRYGFDALGGRMRVSLLRSSYSPDPGSDNGLHEFRVAFVPHGPAISNAEIWRMGMSFNRPPIIVRSNKILKEIAVPSLEGASSVVCTALRRAEHDPDAILLRLFETSGRPSFAKIAVPEQYEAVAEVDFLERPAGDKIKKDKGAGILLRFHPYEIRTLKFNCKKKKYI